MKAKIPLSIWMLCLFVVLMTSTLLIADTFNRSVEVNDGNGTLRAVLFAVDNNNHSGFELKDPEGKVRFSVHTNNSHDPYMDFIDANGKGRIQIGIGPKGEAYIQLRKADGTIVHNLVAPN